MPNTVINRRIMGMSAGAGAGGVCPAGVTFANAWSARVVANGGAAPSAGTVMAIAAFQCGLISDGLNTSMIGWNAFVPDSLTAAITAQLKSPSDTDPWTNNGFTSGSLSINGLVGNGSNYLVPGIKGTDMTGDNNQGISIFMPIINTGAAYDAGASDGALGTRCWMSRKDNNGLSIFGTGGTYPTNQAQAASALGAGFFSGSRVAATGAGAISLYWGNSTNPIASLATSTLAGTARTADVLNLFSINLVGVSANFGPCSNTFSFAAFHSGLSLAQTTKLFARVLTLRQTLGGGFI